MRAALTPTGAPLMNMLDCSVRHQTTPETTLQILRITKLARPKNDVTTGPALLFQFEINEKKHVWSVAFRPQANTDSIQIAQHLLESNLIADLDQARVNVGNAHSIARLAADVPARSMDVTNRTHMQKAYLDSQVEFPLRHVLPTFVGAITMTHHTGGHYVDEQNVPLAVLRPLSFKDKPTSFAIAAKFAKEIKHLSLEGSTPWPKIFDHTIQKTWRSDRDGHREMLKSCRSDFEQFHQVAPGIVRNETKRKLVNIPCHSPVVNLRVNALPPNIRAADSNLYALRPRGAYDLDDFQFGHIEGLPPWAFTQIQGRPPEHWCVFGPYELACWNFLSKDYTYEHRQVFVKHVTCLATYGNIIRQHMKDPYPFVKFVCKIGITVITHLYPEQDRTLLKPYVWALAVMAFAAFRIASERHNYVIHNRWDVTVATLTEMVQYAENSCYMPYDIRFTRPRFFPCDTQYLDANKFPSYDKLYYVTDREIRCQLITDSVTSTHQFVAHVTAPRLAFAQTVTITSRDVLYYVRSHLKSQPTTRVVKFNPRVFDRIAYKNALDAVPRYSDVLPHLCNRRRRPRFWGLRNFSYAEELSRLTRKLRESTAQAVPLVKEVPSFQGGPKIYYTIKNQGCKCNRMEFANCEINPFHNKIRKSTHHRTSPKTIQIRCYGTMNCYPPVQGRGDFIGGEGQFTIKASDRPVWPVRGVFFDEASKGHCDRITELEVMVDVDGQDDPYKHAHVRPVYRDSYEKHGDNACELIPARESYTVGFYKTKFFCIENGVSMSAYAGVKVYVETTTGVQLAKVSFKDDQIRILCAALSKEMNSRMIQQMTSVIRQRQEDTITASDSVLAQIHGLEMAKTNLRTNQVRWSVFTRIIPMHERHRATMHRIEIMQNMIRYQTSPFFTVNDNSVPADSTWNNLTRTFDNNAQRVGNQYVSAPTIDPNVYRDFDGERTIESTVGYYYDEKDTSILGNKRKWGKTNTTYRVSPFVQQDQVSTMIAYGAEGNAPAPALMEPLDPPSDDLVRTPDPVLTTSLPKDLDVRPNALIVKTGTLRDIATMDPAAVAHSCMDAFKKVLNPVNPGVYLREFLQDPRVRKMVRFDFPQQYHDFKKALRNREKRQRKRLIKELPPSTRHTHAEVYTKPAVKETWTRQQRLTCKPGSFGHKRDDRESQALLEEWSGAMDKYSNYTDQHQLDAQTADAVLTHTATVIKPDEEAEPVCFKNHPKNLIAANQRSHECKCTPDPAVEARFRDYVNTLTPLFCEFLDKGFRDKFEG